jgi:hypothetical protein
MFNRMTLEPHFAKALHSTNHYTNNANRWLKMGRMQMMFMIAIAVAKYLFWLRTSL